ncbi:conserved hypothetical protein, partial [Trichinella spiralis]|uniref:hypothetical protein n=1 Tax=Trichinella spiralis TaxID=6334 RepID=UPI0001EFBCB0
MLNCISYLDLYPESRTLLRQYKDQRVGIWCSKCRTPSCNDHFYLFCENCFDQPGMSKQTWIGRFTTSILL